MNFISYYTHGVQSGSVRSDSTYEMCGRARVPEITDMMEVTGWICSGKGGILYVCNKVMCNGDDDDDDTDNA